MLLNLLADMRSIGLRPYTSGNSSSVPVIRFVMALRLSRNLLVHQHPYFSKISNLVRSRLGRLVNLVDSAFVLSEVSVLCSQERSAFYDLHNFLH